MDTSLQYKILIRPTSQTGCCDFCSSLTGFRHGLDGNVLFVSHESQHGENSKTCYKTGAAVQTAQHDAVPEEQVGKR